MACHQIQSTLFLTIPMVLTGLDQKKVLFPMMDMNCLLQNPHNIL